LKKLVQDDKYPFWKIDLVDYFTPLPSGFAGHTGVQMRNQRT
jgi:hypothetical protein